MNLEKFKLAVINLDEFTDEQVEKLFYETEINNVKDIIVIVSLLQRNRPKLFQKLEETIKNRK